MTNIFLAAALTATIFISLLVVLKLTFVSEDSPLTGESSGQQPSILVESPLSRVYENSDYLFPAAWGIVIAILIWKGKTRAAWAKQGYDRDIFRLIAEMRGSATRVRLLQLLEVPRNKLQLADALGMDWKTINNHITLLQRHRLVDELALVGTSKYFIISEHGKNVLYLISEGNNGSKT